MTGVPRKKRDPWAPWRGKNFGLPVHKMGTFLLTKEKRREGPCQVNGSGSQGCPRQKKEPKGVRLPLVEQDRKRVAAAFC